MKNINRGSEWRRWELHLHTPFTKKEDRFIGNTAEEKWNEFYNTIHDYIGDGTDPLKTICVIGITDYLSIDNYKTVITQKRLPDCVELVLPNVELRMKPIAQKTPINIHCIFSPEIVDEIDERFFAKLEFEYNNIRFAATRTQLIAFGRAYLGKDGITDEEAYSTGLCQYVISNEILSDVFKKDPKLRNNTIIVVSNKSTDGVSGTNSHSDYFVGDIPQLDATRRSIYQLSDMIFSSSNSDINYFLGQKNDSEDMVKLKCGSLMPCIHGCDAHTNSKIFEPDNKRYCWIKSDPTFEGLKQILYEPKERVCISSTYPSSKQDYQVIDYIEIIGNKEFSSKPIYFNENLNCIIGGKSTGKSLLLHNIALAIDPIQVKEKEEISITNVKKIQQFNIHWRDKTCSKDENDTHKIIYIPQTYLNRLSDEKEETTEIDKIIQDIVLQDENASLIFKEMNKKISDHKQCIAKETVTLLNTISDYRNIFASKKEIGDKNGIILEIDKLTNQLEILSKEYNVTEEEIKTYQSSVETAQEIITKLKEFDREKQYLATIESVLQKKDFSQKIIFHFEDEFINAINKIQSVADSQWLIERSDILEKVEKGIFELKQSLSIYQENINKLKPKMEGNEQINKISQAILLEKEKLDKTTKYDLELSEIKKRYNTQIDILTNSFINYKSFYLEYVNEINSKFAMPAEDLEFKVNCVFRIEQFTQKLLNILNNHSISRFRAFDINNIIEENLNPLNLRILIESILTNSSSTLQLKKGHTAESALRDIFDDWYNIDYTVTMDDDNIEDMSPGKKALVLLRLLISLAESRCPILIDQPEDDLDNRSIFDELIQFIKVKKIDRQIICVTHNANIVLGGDAELIIVANQNGKNSPNENYRFEYHGGSIENNSPTTTENGEVQNGVLYEKGIQTHICEILEGGERAFDLRRNKYNFIKE